MFKGSDIHHYLQFSHYRAKAELARDASNMFLGFAWWILEPLIFMAVFYFVFGLGLRKGGTDFVCYLLCGLVPWKWLDSTVRTASSSVASSAGLMRQVYFPKWILPVYIILANTYKYLIVLVLLIISLQLINGNISVVWLWLVAVVAVQLFFIIGLSLVCAAFVPLIPDLRYVINYGMTLLFFVSGIFFSINDLAPPIRDTLSWLPSVLIIDFYRDILLFNLSPNLLDIAVVVAQAIGLMLIGCYTLVKLDRYYPRVLG